MWIIISKIGEDVEENIRDLLEIYARRIDFKLKDSPQVLSVKKDPLLAVFMTGQSKNAFCNDNMNVFIRVDGSIVNIHHYGEYCSLSNASAELFCEMVNGIELSTLKKILQSISLYLRTSNIDSLEEYNRFRIMYEIIQIPMSATRKRCITLPWEATIDAFTS